MNGLNVLPRTYDTGVEQRSFGINQRSLAPVAGDFAELLKALLLASQEQEEGQPTEEKDDRIFLQTGLESLFLNYPAGKEANSGQEAGQGIQNLSSIMESVLTHAGKPVTAIGQYREFWAQGGLSTWTRTDLANEAMPQTELDQYKLTIIRLLQELNGKIQWSTKSSTTTDMMQAMAAAKVYNQDFVTVSQTNMFYELSVEAAQKAEQFMRLTLGEQQGKLAQTLQSTTENLLATQQAIIANERSEGSIDPRLAQTFNPASSEGSGITEIASQGISKQDLEQSAFGNEQSADRMSKWETGKMEPVSANTTTDLVDSSLGIKENNGLNTSSTANISNGEKGSAPSLLQQIIQAIYKQTDVLAQRPYTRPQIERVEIQLHPAELGKIHLSVRLEDGQVHLFVQASEQSTASLLQQHLGDLRQNLTNMGLNCGNFEMGSGNDQDNAQHESRSQSELRREHYREIIDETTLPITYFEEHSGQLNLTV